MTARITDTTSAKRNKISEKTTLFRRERGGFLRNQKTPLAHQQTEFSFIALNFYLFQLECAGVEAVVGAFLRDEVAVAATFDDVAVVEHHDDVGVLDRR